MSSNDPDIEAQKRAMKRLEFLTGTWSGQVKTMTQQGAVTLHQTEEVRYSADGLTLNVEGTGRYEDGTVGFKAAGIISYDDKAGEYRFRTSKDGQQIDAKLEVDADNKGFKWGFTVENNSLPVKVEFTMRLNEQGAWIEKGYVTLGAQPPNMFLILAVDPQKPAAPAPRQKPPQP